MLLIVKRKTYIGERIMSEDETEGSEFGKGFVTCLVKFARHFENDSAKRIYLADQYYNRHKDIPEIELTVFGIAERYWTDRSSIVGELMVMWANGASDHLYEMEVPFIFKGTKVEELVNRLRDKGLEIGHSYNHKNNYGLDDLEELMRLTSEIAMEIDKELGLEPDIGKYE